MAVQVSIGLDGEAAGWLERERAEGLTPRQAMERLIHAAVASPGPERRTWRFAGRVRLRRLTQHVGRELRAARRHVGGLLNELAVALRASATLGAERAERRARLAAAEAGQREAEARLRDLLQREARTTKQREWQDAVHLAEVNQRLDRLTAAVDTAGAHTARVAREAQQREDERVAQAAVGLAYIRGYV